MDAMEKASFNSTAWIKISGRMGEDDTGGAKKRSLLEKERRVATKRDLEMRMRVAAGIVSDLMQRWKGS